MGLSVVLSVHARVAGLFAKRYRSFGIRAKWLEVASIWIRLYRRGFHVKFQILFYLDAWDLWFGQCVCFLNVEGTQRWSICGLRGKSFI